MSFQICNVDRPDSFEAIRSSFAELVGEDDGLRISQIDVESPLYRSLKQRGIARPFLVYEISPPDTLHITTLPESYEAFLARRGGKTRKNLKREFRVLETKLGDVAWKSYETESDVDAFLKVAAPVADASWQSKVEETSLGRQAYHAEKYRQRAARGNLLAYTLVKQDGSAIAFWLGDLRGDTLYLEKVGYDPGFADVAPAKMLLYRMLELEMAREPRRFNIINWGHGDQPYKRDFSTQKSNVADVWLLKKTWKNRLWVARHGAPRRLVAWLKKSDVLLEIKRRFVPARH